MGNSRDTNIEQTWKIISNKKNNYIIWGAGAAGQKFFDRYRSEINVIAFVDSNREKNTQMFNGLKVKTPEELEKNENQKIIICVLGFYNEIEDLLLKKGYVENRDFFYEKEFVTIFEFKKNDKLHLWHLNIHITEHCTLKCRDCSVMIPQIRNPSNLSIKKLYSDLNVVFKNLDFIEELHIIGGEPMVYPDLCELIEFIGINFRTKIGEFAIATNGTVLANEKLIELSYRYDVLYIISDYSNSDDFFGNQKGNQLNKLLGSHSIKTRYSDKNLWLDFGDPLKVKIDEKKNMSVRFKKCRNINRVLCAGKLYYCHHHLGAIMAGYAMEDADASIDIEKNTELKKVDILNFDLGNLKTGYLDFCKKCNGYERLNKKWIQAAKQITDTNV